MKKINKALVIQNGLSREECAAFFELLSAAEEWCDIMVQSNGPYGDDRHGDGRKHWATVRNHNGRLVTAVYAARDVIGTTDE